MSARHERDPEESAVPDSHAEGDAGDSALARRRAAAANLEDARRSADAARRELIRATDAASIEAGRLFRLSYGP